MKRSRILILSIVIVSMLTSMSMARYYVPQTGRYLTPDPIGLAGGINPYVYVENDPINMVDPDGRMPLIIIPFIAAGALLYYYDFANAPSTATEPLCESTATIDMMNDSIFLFGVLSGQGGGRGSGKIVPYGPAQGPHSVFKRNPAGQITNYRTYEPNPYAPDRWIERFGYDAIGKPHYNKVTGRDVPTPHVHDPLAPGGVRIPGLGEIPGGP